MNLLPFISLVSLTPSSLGFLSQWSERSELGEWRDVTSPLHMMKGMRKDINNNNKIYKIFFQLLLLLFMSFPTHSLLSHLATLTGRRERQKPSGERDRRRARFTLIHLARSSERNVRWESGENETEPFVITSLGSPVVPHGLYEWRTGAGIETTALEPPKAWPLRSTAPSVTSGSLGRCAGRITYLYHLREGFARGPSREAIRDPPEALGNRVGRSAPYHRLSPRLRLRLRHCIW